jgi:hypothetical protein
MTIQLCHTFQTLAACTWKTINVAHSCGMRWSEESNTEFLLLNLRLHHPKEISITAFTKRKEASNGADWQWWFLSSGASYGMLIQAKRVGLPEETFDKLYHKDQMNRLIEAARADGLTPAYCFYVASDRLSWNPAWPMYEQRQTGCLIGHAEQVRDAHSKRLSRLSPLLMPWHFLVCQCAGDASSGIAHRAAAAMSRMVEGGSTGEPQAQGEKEKPWLAEVRTRPPS